MCCNLCCWLLSHQTPKSPHETATTQKSVLYIYILKKSLIILLVFVGLYTNGHSQQAVPAGVANDYSLGEKDGYAGFNYAAIYHGPSGKVYTRTYDGDIAIHGNNYTLPLKSISRQPAALGYFKEINYNEAWYYDTKKIVIIKQDTVSRIVSLPTETNYYLGLHNSIIYLFQKKGQLETWLFDGTELKLKATDSSAAINSNSGLYPITSEGIFFLTNVVNDSLNIFKLNPSSFLFSKICAYRTGNVYVYYIKDALNLFGKKIDTEGGLLSIENGVVNKTFTLNSQSVKYFTINLSSAYGLITHHDSYRQIFNPTPTAGESELPVFISEDNTNLLASEKFYGSFYATTGNKPIRIFTTLKKYPSLFNNSHSNSIFSLQEDNENNIWAGCYQGGISIIKNNNIHSLPGINSRITNGGSAYKDKIYMITEGIAYGLIQLNKKGDVRLLSKKTTGFYSFITGNQKDFYFGTGSYNGLWKTTTTALENANPVWNIIDSTKGLKLHNILTITEDKAGRIWCGHPRRGIAVYEPKNDQAQTWLVEKNETTFGAFSSITDKNGTVWLGSSGKGLWYYNDYSKTASPANCKQLNHPLLNISIAITALTIYNQWLVISAYDKMLLLNLDSFYLENKLIVRYLNPQEAGFTSFTEQNTLLTSKKDSSIWFSTSDMLYQWNMKKWLNLPVYKVATSVFVTAEKHKTIALPNKSISFAAGVNSFDIHVQYLSPDNMPRYTRAALIKEGDAVLLPEPSLQHIYNIKNIRSGQYSFVLDVFEMDGTTSSYVYKIIVQKFFWQQWWFWALLSSAFIGIITFFINQEKHRQLAEQKAKTIAAELLSFKNEQEKKLANMQVVSLSSQFRPHFILNALNTIGAQMDDKPEAEIVLSRLGESINLIFSHAQQQKIAHSFIDEWTLVKNIIHIHQLMYLKQLEVNTPAETFSQELSQVNVPLGLLQIPVENALLHGLSNKEKGPWQLTITVNKIKDTVIVSITDNGVGRAKAATLSNYRKHGAGTKNLAGILDIVNANNPDKITIQYEDDVITTGDETYGTTVIISIPIHFNYEA